MEWNLADWLAPELDRKIICHRTMSRDDLRRFFSKSTGQREQARVLREAERYADEAEAAGIPVSNDDWTFDESEDAWLNRELSKK